MSTRRRKDHSRDGGAFVALPVSVLNSVRYIGLSYRAKALLVDVAMQVNTRKPNNGRLLVTEKHMRLRGWTSHDMLLKAKAELLEAEMLFETVKGCRPNRAGWYAVTWRDLEPHPGYDLGAAGRFDRGAYSRGTPTPPILSSKPSKSDWTLPNGGRTPAGSEERASRPPETDGISKRAPAGGVGEPPKVAPIAPAGGVMERLSTPPGGVIDGAPTPPGGVSDAFSKRLRAGS